MSTLVESLRRLYLKKSPVVTEPRLRSMVEEGKITDEELEYILAE